jgi:hypothetical protein
LQIANINFLMSVRPHGKIQLPLDRCPWNLILESFPNSVEKTEVSLRYGKCNGHFTRRYSICTFMIIISSFSSYSKKHFRICCRENQNPHFMYNNLFSRKSWRLWDNIEKYDTAGQAADNKRRMRFACWITKATGTHSEYVILTTPPWQQWLRGRHSVWTNTSINASFGKNFCTVSSNNMASVGNLFLTNR